MVQTTKFYLIFQETEDMNYEKFNQIMWDIQKRVQRFKNRASSEYFTFMMKREQWKAENGKYPTDIDILGNTMRNHLYHMATNEIPQLNTGNSSMLSESVVKYYKKRYADILFGRTAVPSYKENQPVAITNQNICIQADNSGKIHMVLSLLSDKGVKEYNLRTGRYTFHVWHKCESSIAILQHCITKEYKVCGSYIQYDRRKGMWELALSYEFENPQTNLDRGKILGIDLGIAVPIVAAISNSDKKWFFRGDEIQAFRAKTEAIRSQMSKSRVDAGDGSVGHGRDKRMQCVDRLGERIANFRDTKNGAWSRRIVDIAVKNGCGTIQMEDLSGITSGKQPYFLKSWTYYDLQQKIKYKAEAAGIDFVLIDPKHTSQRCSVCGFISADNRKTQDQFICQKCGYEENADYNAARNIATKDIEKIIEKQCGTEKRTRSKHKIA